MTESLATAVEENSTSIEQMSRSIQAVAAERPSDQRRRHRCGRSATQLERIDRIGRRSGPPRRRADDAGCPRCRGRRGRGPAVDPGDLALAGIDVAVVQVMSEMGKRTTDIGIDRRHHQPDRRADQSPVAECLDRSGASRRRGPRVCGRRRRDPQPGRPVGEGHGRHRRDHQGTAGGRPGRDDARRTKGSASPTTAARWRRAARRVSRKILAGLAETATLGQSDRAGDRRAAGGGADCRQQRLPRRPNRPGRSRPRPPSRSTIAIQLVQATGQMRKIAQEIAKAVAEQGRAARDVIKAAQSTIEGWPSQVRKATGEQAKSAAEIAQAVDSMRRGAATTARAVGEQAIATEQIAKVGRRSGASGGQCVARDGRTVDRRCSRSPAAIGEHAARSRQQAAQGPGGTDARDEGRRGGVSDGRPSSIKLIHRAPTASTLDGLGGPARRRWRTSAGSPTATPPASRRRAAAPSDLLAQATAL